MASRIMGLIGYLIVVAALLKSATAETHKVGDSTGWTVPTSSSFYEDWARSKTFNLYDGLLFEWSGNHNAFEVTKAEYDSCTKTNVGLSVTNATELALITTGTRYFICTVDTHCESGQKVAITVGGAPSPSSPPPPPNSASSLSTVGALSSLLISTIVMAFFTYI